MAQMNLRYFAWVREQIGKESETVSVPAGVVTVSDLVGFLKTKGANYEHALAKASVIRAAIDGAHVKPDAPIEGAREIAFFPPVTGG